MKRENPRAQIARRPDGQVAFAATELFYWGAYAATAFIAAYMKDMGFSASLIGLVMALVNCVGILCTPLMGDISDRLRSPRRVFVFCVAASSLLFCLVPAAAGSGAAPALLIGAVLVSWAFFKNPTPSLLDAWVIRAVDRLRTFTYGSVRFLGSLGYATLCLVYGLIAKKTGTYAQAFYIYALVNLPLVFIVFSMRRRFDFGDAPAERVRGTARQKSGVAAALKNYYFRMFLISHAVTGVALYCLTTFLPYKLSELSGDASMLGTVIALRSYMEIPALLFGARLVKRFGVRSLLAFSTTAFLIEQVVCIAAARVWLVTAALMLHGFANGVYLSCVAGYIYRIAPEGAGASAQSTADSFKLLAAVLGNLAGGVLVDLFDSTGYFAFALALQFVALAAYFVTIPLGRKLGHEPPALTDP